jgi:hypothetical protein
MGIIFKMSILMALDGSRLDKNKKDLRSCVFGKIVKFQGICAQNHRLRVKMSKLVGFCEGGLLTELSQAG